MQSLSVYRCVLFFVFFCASVAFFVNVMCIVLICVSDRETEKIEEGGVVYNVIFVCVCALVFV